MADDRREERIGRLAERFQKHGRGGQPELTSRPRARLSLYLDRDLVTRASEQWKDAAHELRPLSVSKSTFLETLLEYGLDHLDDIKKRIREKAEG